MSKISKHYYLAKAKLLTMEETERLLSRIMGSKLERRLEKNKLSELDALARQLELEDQQLQEWRKIMLDLKAKDEAKKAAKAKSASKAKSPAKAKTPTKAKVVKKAKVQPSK